MLDIYLGELQEKQQHIGYTTFKTQTLKNVLKL
jgi:hypothetical protein